MRSAFTKSDENYKGAKDKSNLKIICRHCEALEDLFYWMIMLFSSVLPFQIQVSAFNPFVYPPTSITILTARYTHVQKFKLLLYGCIYFYHSIAEGIGLNNNCWWQSKAGVMLNSVRLTLSSSPSASTCSLSSAQPLNFSTASQRVTNRFNNTPWWWCCGETANKDFKIWDLVPSFF